MKVYYPLYETVKMDQNEVMRALHKARLRDDLRQIDEHTLDARVDRYMEIEHQGIIGNHYFAAASLECINLYRDGHFIAAVMLSHAVNEAILKLLNERNGIRAADHSELMGQLHVRNVISEACAAASEKIWKSFRNDVHHMNPKVATIPFPQLAKSNIQALAVVEREVFAVDIKDGKLLPKNPLYWDVQKDGTVPVFLRLGI